MANYISKDQARAKLIECVDVRRVNMAGTNPAASGNAWIDTEGRNGR